jgi:hypothetical protein
MFRKISDQQSYTVLANRIALSDFSITLPGAPIFSKESNYANGNGN